MADGTCASVQYALPALPSSAAGQLSASLWLHATPHGFLPNRSSPHLLPLTAQVYNITHYLRFHPGGVPLLLKVAGKDGTALFNKYHAWVGGCCSTVGPSWSQLAVGCFSRWREGWHSAVKQAVD